MKKQGSNARLDQAAVKAMATVARGVAKNSINATSWLWINQPKEPENLGERLRAMKKD